jgi:hypothetical protein
VDELWEKHDGRADRRGHARAARKREGNGAILGRDAHVPVFF